MITDADIADGFRWILGRAPSAEEIAAKHRELAALNAGAKAGATADAMGELQRLLLGSAEFRARRLALRKASPDRLVELDQPRLVFLHVEKCGGTTLHAMLTSQFDAGSVCPERQDQLGDWTVNELAAFRLFSGHFELSCCRSIPGALRLVTMLREPRSRLLSLFHFWKSHRPHPGRDAFDLLLLARACSAEEFFAHPAVIHHWSIRNAIAGQLTRTATRMLLPGDLLLSDPPAAVERAWSELERFAAIGIMEQFDASRRLLNQRLGLRMQPIAPLQVLDDLVRGSDELVAVRREPMSERLHALLDPLVEIDRVLYARALARFEESLASLPPSAAAAPRPSVLRRAAARIRRAMP